jgi:membrane associated rhomboid family serine protease
MNEMIVPGLKRFAKFSRDSSSHIVRSITGREKAGPRMEKSIDLTDPRQILAAPRNAAHTVKEEIAGVLFFIGVMWATFLLDGVLPLSEWFALIPRRVTRLPGIPLMPFLHGNWYHIISNTIPLFVLLTLLAGSRARSWLIVLCLIMLSGGLLWLAGLPWLSGQPERTHVGASALIFGLVTFLISSAYFERRFVPMVVAIVVGFLYGSNLLFGVLPIQAPGVSWEGHFSGALAGIGVAYAFTRKLRNLPGTPQGA